MSAWSRVSTGYRRRRTLLTALAAAPVLVAAWLPAAGADEGSGGWRDGWRIARTFVVPEVEVSAGVTLGGLSDLAVAPPAAPADRLRLWSLTDRGPNGTVKTSGGTRRTLLEPGFVPALVLLECDEAATVKRIVPLAGRSGKPLSGKPNGIGRDEPVLAADGMTPIAADPDGIDPEGLVPMNDGTFWIAEEYRPSLLHVGGDGRLMARYVPEGHLLEGADGEVRPVLPAAYGLRRDNRGFEGLAATADGSRLWAILQSPIAGPGAKDVKRAKKTGNVRLLAFDPAAGRPVAEHLYRLGDPVAPGYLTAGAPPEDGKLCAIAAIGPERLLVLEQDDTGLARLYRADLAGSTDTLGWRPSARVDDAPSDGLVDTIRDLPAAGIVPVTKRLVADLTVARRLMGHDATAPDGDARRTPDDQPARAGLLKLEGLAVLDDRHIAFGNDNDFSVHDPMKPQRTCIWIVELAEPLSAR